MSSVRDQDQATPPDVDDRSAQERAIDEFLATADAEFGAVPDEVLADVRAAWPE